MDGSSVESGLVYLGATAVHSFLSEGISNSIQQFSQLFLIYFHVMLGY